MTAAVSGIGVVLERHGDDMRTDSDVQVAQVASITGPTQSADFIDVSNMGSSGGFREFISGLRDAGEITFELVYDPDSTTSSGGIYAQAALQTDFNNGTTLYWRIEFNNPGADTMTMHGTRWDFEGPVTGYSLSVPTDDAVRATCSIKVTGQVTFTAAM